MPATDMRRARANVVDAGQDAGEIAKPEDHGRGKQKLVRGSDKLPATLPELGIDRRRLAEARALGVARRTVADWLADETVLQSKKGFRPDNRVKVPPKARPDIVARVEGGDR